MTLAERATEALRRALINGTFQPGSALTEREACEFLHMSRSPVRSAFHTLATEGLLLYEAKRGYRIRRVSLSTVVEAYQVRGALESLACRLLAIKGVSKRTEATLVASVEHGKTLLENRGSSFNHQDWREMNRSFHTSILEATDNETLNIAFHTAAMHPLASLTFIPTLDSEPDYTSLQLAQSDHEKILNALRSRDAVRASSRMLEHIEVASEFLCEGLRQHPQISKTLGLTSTACFG